MQADQVHQAEKVHEELVVGEEDEMHTNGVQVIGLYPSFTAVDPVIEYLLDQGFSHTDITLLSGRYWPAILQSLGHGDEAGRIYIHGREVYLQVNAEGDRARLARDILCNSGPLDVRVRRAEDRSSAQVKIRHLDELEQVR